MSVNAEKTSGAHGRGAKRRKSKHIARIRKSISVGVAVISMCCAAVFAFRFILHLIDLSAFQKEQAAISKISPFDAELLEINSDYVGHIKIEDTNIDYPVVRGSDNEKYLNTTFKGEHNKLGAIFMDYRCAGKDAPHIIIYGHQAADKDKNPLAFGGLDKFLDEQYRLEHQKIMFLENDNLYEYKIFSARMSDINDPAYDLDFEVQGTFQAFLKRIGAPPDAENVVTLSTCIGADNDRRMIVQGTLIRIVPVKAEYGEKGWEIIRPY
jgi:sortase B